jgi:hypothetical protein
MNFLVYFSYPFLICIFTIFLSFFPVWCFANLLKLDALTRLLVSIMGGFALMYFLEFGAYVFSAPKWLPLLLLFLGTIISVGYLFRGRCSDSYPPIPWEGLAAWLALSLWIMAFQVNTLNFGTQIGWYGDWFEHYERSIFFMDQLPLSTTFLENLFSLPARGPLFNSIAGLLMSGLGREFWIFQTIATVLNAFPVLAMGLLIRDIVGWKQNRALFASAIIFGCAPFAVQQIVFTWTKFFAVGFILSGIHLYLVGYREKRSDIIGLSFLVFSFGILAHYMVLVPMMFFLGHFLYASIKDFRIFKAQIFHLGVLVPLILSSWFLFLIVTFGVKGTLHANTAIGKEYTEIYNKKIGHNPSSLVVFKGNMLSSFFPYSWRRSWKGLGGTGPVLNKPWIYAPSTFSEEEKKINEVTEQRCDIVNNQSSLMGNLGFAGGVGLIIALWVLAQNKLKTRIGNKDTPSDAIHRNNLQPSLGFWAIFVLLGIPLNILPLPIYMVQGAAYAHLQVYICLAIIWILWTFNKLSRGIKCLLTGIFLLESGYTNYISLLLHSRPFESMLSKGMDLILSSPEGLNPQYVNNFLLKSRMSTVFLFDIYQNHTLATSVLYAFFSLTLLSFVFIKTKNEESRLANKT